MTKKIKPQSAQTNTNADIATTDVLQIIRQLEPEAQNELVSKVLQELATDRYNAAKAKRDESERAGRNLELFMMNAIGLEKILAEKKVLQ